MGHRIISMIPLCFLLLFFLLSVPAGAKPNSFSSGTCLLSQASQKIELSTASEDQLQENKTPNKKNSGRVIEIRPVFCRLYLGSSNVLRAECGFKNLGNVEAKSFRVHCYFVVNKKINGGEDYETFASIRPGETVFRTFSSAMKLNPRRNYTEIVNDGKTARVYSGPSKGSLLIYEVECRFKFNEK